MRPGYKQTEVGVIPEDWEVRPLSNVSWFQEGPGVRNTQFTSSGVKLLNGTNIFRGELDLETTNRFISEREAHGPYAHFLAEEGDIVIASSGITVERLHEKVAFVRTAHLPFCMNTSTIRFRPHVDLLLPEFLFQFLTSDGFKRPIGGQATGSAQLNFGPSHVARVPIALPSLAEQRAIATALSEADGLSAGLDRLIAKRRDIKQAAQQRLLTGQTRLPGFNGEWEMRRLGEIAHIKTGSRNNEDKVEDGEYPFFVRSETVERINSYSHDCEAILVPGEGRIGDIFHYIDGRFDVHQRVYAITQFKPGVSGKFVYLYMAMNFGAWAMQNTVKATVDSLRLPTFQAFKLLVPPTIGEQAAIAAVLSDMDAELAALEARRDKTRALKQGMMQEVLTGRTRLVAPNEVEVEV